MNDTQHPKTEISASRCTRLEIGETLTMSYVIVAYVMEKEAAKPP